jgi:hypothetical protein
VQFPESRIKHILEVQISAQDAGFDQEEFDGLVEAVRAAMDRTSAPKHSPDSPAIARSKPSNQSLFGLVA